MRLLLDGKYLEFTGDFYLLEAKPEEVAAKLIPVSERVTGQTLKKEVIHAPIERMISECLPPCKAMADRHLVVPTDGHWTAVFGNTSNPPGPRWATTRLGCRGLRVVAVPNSVSKDGKSGRLGGTFFELYDGDRLIRSVVCYNDCGKWKFMVKGVTQEFERTDQYEVKPTKEKFTFEMLDEYCRALGIRAFDDDFYKDEAILVSP